MKKPPHVQILRYMGSKRALLPIILYTINHKGLVQHGGTILDLFAGTNCVGYALKENYRIISNDFQKYSYITALALLNNKRTNITDDEIKKIIEYAKFNYSLLRKKEKRIPKNQYDSKYSKSNHPINNIYKNDNEAIPYCLFSYYFAERYFSIKNCMKIDSLRFGIDKYCKEKNDSPLKNLLLCCLLYSMSYSVRNTGHFAQYIKFDFLPNEEDVIDLFVKKCKEMNILSSEYKNLCFNESYLDLIDNNRDFQKIKNQIDLVYLDPPYSSAQYSRFYHIPETLIQYNYPQCNLDGRYPSIKERKFSNFSYVSKAHKEFDILIKKTSEINPKIRAIINYSDHGIVGIEELIKISKKYFNQVSYKNISHLHFAQNMSKKIRKNHYVKEWLIICKDPIN